MHHVFGDRRLGHLEAKHQKLAMDPGCAPQWVFSAHPLDQIPQAAIDLWPPYSISGFPTPEHFETSAMPPQDGLRLNYLDHAEQVRPEPGHPYEQRPISVAQSKTWWCPAQSDVELNGSFNARLRDELLNGEIFYTLREVQVIIESWRRHDNAVRPHISLGYKPPAPQVFVPAFAAWPAALRRPAPPAMLAQLPALN